jgi:hypothetical protein
MSQTEKDYKKRRITDVLYNHWDSARAGKLFPAYEDIKPEQLKHVWEDAFVLKVMPLITGYGFSVVHQGKNFGDDFIRHSTGFYIKNMITGFFETASDLYKKVVESQEPYRSEEIYTAESGEQLKYRQIILPLGDAESGKVTHIIGGMRFLALKE